jgi:6-phosphogluconolactonase
MTIEVLPDAQAVARRGAQWIAAQARLAIAARGRFVLAVSGGSTPWLMLRELTRQAVSWNDVDIVQVDERMAPAGSPERNFTALCDSLRAAPLATERIHALPVDAVDLAEGAARYSKLLESIAGSPPVLDVAHLGLGADGHTASLVPGDPVLEVADADVAWSGEYMGQRRMTLTYPMLNRARQILWLVTGSQKAEALARLRRGDRSIPAGRIRQDAALVLADGAAAGL